MAVRVKKGESPVYVPARKKAAVKPAPTPRERKTPVPKEKVAAVPKSRATPPARDRVDSARRKPAIFRDFTLLRTMEETVAKIPFDFILDKTARYRLTVRIEDMHGTEVLEVKTETSSFYLNDVLSEGKEPRWVRNFGFPALDEVEMTALDSKGAQVATDTLDAPRPRPAKGKGKQEQMNFDAKGKPTPL